MKREELTTFAFRVDDGEEQTMTAKSGIYQHAAAAVPSLAGVDVPCVVEIWCPGLRRRFFYRIRDDEYGSLVVEHVVRDRAMLSPSGGGG